MRSILTNYKFGKNRDKCSSSQTAPNSEVAELSSGELLLTFTPARRGPTVRIRVSIAIADHSFQYAAFRLWNQLPASLRQPRTNLSNSDSPSPLSGTCSIGSIDSPVSSSITPSLFHPRLKIFLYCKSFPPQPSFYSSGLTPRIPPDCSPILLSLSVLLFTFSFFPLFTSWFRAVD